VKINNLEKISIENVAYFAYETQLNVFKLNNIFPHEETIDNNNITYDIVRNSRLVLGVEFIFEDDIVEVEDKLFILDGHHRFNFINENKIDEDIGVVLIDIKKVSINSYNCELMVNKDKFFNIIYKDYNFNNNPKFSSNPFISINKEKYFSEKILNLKDLYSYKKLLMQKKIINPSPNNIKHHSDIVQFSPLSYQDFEKGYLFPHKSTWITPRFNS